MLAQKETKTVVIDEAGKKAYVHFSGTVDVDQVIEAFVTLEASRADAKSYELIVEGRELMPGAEDKAKELSERKGMKIETRFSPDDVLPSKR